jgi:hypothetical protein
MAMDWVVQLVVAVLVGEHVAVRGEAPHCVPLYQGWCKTL